MRNENEENEDDLLRSAALRNAETIRIARQRAEHKAEAAQLEQANLLNLTHDTIFVYGINGAIRYWNRAAEELYGWTAEEALGKLAHQLLNTAFPMPLAEIEAEVMRSGRWEGELVHTRKDGNRVVVASRWSLRRDEKGVPDAILQTNNDITERKRAEEAREEVEQQWRAAFENNPTMYFIVDAALSTVSVNPFGAEHLGYAVGELIGQPVLNVFYQPDRQAVERHAQECLAHPGRTQRWEARKIRKDGTMLWVRETANAVVLRNRPVMLVVCEDITERKRAEQALTRSEAYLAEAQRLTHTGSWAYNPVTRKIIYWSEEMFRIHGLDPQRSSPPQHDELRRVGYPAEADLAEVIAVATRHKSGFTTEFKIALADGTSKYLQCIGHPVLDEAGQVVEFVGSAIDITERKKAEAERDRLRQLEADLAHINRATTMGELTASLAHEVNQPISAVLTNANTCVRWLAGESPDVEEAREAAKRTVKSANRAVEIIGRIRSLFKKSAPQRELLDVNDLIVEMIALLRSEAIRCGVLIHTELAPHLPQVAADRVQLQQVLMNLMVNAMQAMKGVDGNRELTLLSRRDGSQQVQVSVADTGVGLPAEGDQIFKAFFTTRSDGTGMGLAISRSIIDSHGGRLWATGNDGPGATFHFMLPLPS